MGSNTDTSSPRTLTANGPLIAKYRKHKSWTREEFEWQSHLAVEHAALHGNADARFRRRYEARKSNGKFSGIGVTTLTNLERSRNVYVFTLKIVALTLDVPMAALIHPRDKSGMKWSPGGADSSAQRLAAGVVRKARGGGAMSGPELARVLRAVLDELVPPADEAPADDEHARDEDDGQEQKEAC